MEERGSGSIIPTSIAGSGNLRRNWRLIFAKAGSRLWAIVGEWTKPARIKGQWKYLYRAVDKAGQTIDFLLTARRDKKAALHFFKKAVGRHGFPSRVTIDKSGANTAALEALKEETGQAIGIRQIKYLNNHVEPDHRAIK
jgi:transposase-like protein